MEKLAKILIKKRKFILISWIFIFVFSVINLLLNKNSFETGIGEIEGSISKQVSEKIKTNFKEPFSGNIIITVSNSKPSSDEGYKKIIDDLEFFLKKESEIKNVFSPFNSSINNFISPDRKTFALLIQLHEQKFSYAEAYVPKLRENIKNFLEIKEEKGLKIKVTGNAAYSYDMNKISEAEGEKAEKKVFILTFFILVFAFGSVGASVLAVISGFMATIITISFLKIFTGFITLSVFCQNITSMMGLALGIDYSLLLITRYRQEIKSGDKLKALIETLKTAGESVLYSGITVLIGFMGLLLTGVNITFSIGMGGVMVVFFSILIAITFTPLLLYIFDKYLNFPLFLSRITNNNSFNLREKFSNFVMKNSLWTTIFSLIFLLLLSYPILSIKLAEPDINSMPDSMESKQGFTELGNISSGNPVFPIYLLVNFQKSKVYETENLVNLYNFVEKLKKDQRIGEIISVVNLIKGLSITDYLLFYSTGMLDNQLKPVNDFLLSNDKNMTIIQVFPSKKLSSYENNRLVEDLRKLTSDKFEVTTGGPASVSFDLVIKLFEKFPFIIAFIYLVTFILLAYAFKSILIPIKAIILNSLSVFASYGFLVLVFQYGYFNSLFGIKYLPESIVSAMPVILFCIMFSLSMDYEVFLLSRMYEEYNISGDNEKAIFIGLTETSGVISKAAMIMLVVFGAFVQADIILIKMSGLGLAVAVFLDSTIIRLLLVPSFMKLAGKANWYLPFFNLKK